MLTKPLTQTLSLYLILSMFVLSLPAPGWAMFIPTEAPAGRAEDAAKIRAALESTVIKQRLMDYGLSADEAVKRLDSLSDEEVHRFAEQLDAVQAGSGLGSLVFLLLVVIIVVLVLQATGHRIVIR